MSELLTDRSTGSPLFVKREGFADFRADIWGLAGVVQALCAPRAGSELRPRDRRRGELPSREALVRIVNGLRAALFPAHFGPADLTDDGVDYFVGHTINVALYELHAQIARSLRYVESPADRAVAERHAAALTREACAHLPRVRRLLETDLQATPDGDSDARHRGEALFCDPGVTALIHHRIAHVLHALDLTLIARIISQIAHGATGIDIHPGARIGEGFAIDHGTGVVIGETCVIGKHVRVHHGVTLGSGSYDHEGGSSKGEPRDPSVEDDVVIYSGATLVGPISIGRGSIIGGNVWLTRSVPPGSRVTQAQVRSEAYSDGGGI